MNNHVELSSRAKKDLRRIGPGRVQAQLVAAMVENLEANPQPDNADVKALAGAAPWLRLRSGDYRVLYRALDRAELKALGLPDGQAGFLVARVVARGELDRAVVSL